ncbi:MAG: NERD domain-containing protein [Bacilli bacterium]|nr:NERD domain-containing protein [Bacilli bacterium]
MWIVVLVALIVLLVVMVFIRAYESRRNPSTIKLSKTHAEIRDRAEDKVDEMLRGLSQKHGGYVYHDLFLEEKEGLSSELDHLYLSTAGIFLLETKGEAAVVKGEVEDPSWKGRTAEGHKDIVNPVAQNKTHEERLKSLWGEGFPKLYTMSVFPYGDVTLISEFAFNLKSAEEYIEEQLSHPSYTQEEVEGFNKRLMELQEKFGITREKHYENVRNRKKEEA